MVDSAYKVSNAPYLIRSSNVVPDDVDGIRVNRDAISI